MSFPIQLTDLFPAAVLAALKIGTVFLLMSREQMDQLAGIAATSFLQQVMRILIICFDGDLWSQR